MPQIIKQQQQQQLQQLAKTRNNNFVANIKIVFDNKMRLKVSNMAVDGCSSLARHARPADTYFQY